MTDQELQVILDRCASATAGPWRSFVEGRDHTAGPSFIKTSEDDFELNGATVADQDFIAAARQDIPALLAEISRLKALLSSLGDQ